jgi:acetyl-CoA acetyltransferase family protein
VRLANAYIPVRFGWSSPFARWQGAFADLPSIDLGVQVTREALDRGGLPPSEISRVVLGTTTPQKSLFYGGPTFSARIGAEAVTGPMIAQACATSAACIEIGALHADAAGEDVNLVVATDRTSNSPLVIYPQSKAAGGAPLQEHWFFDNIAGDPWAGKPMIGTAERVAEQAGITREQADEVTLLRYEQYQTALADDRAFQRAYMIPVTLPSRRGEPQVIDSDVGIYETTAEGLAKLEPTVPGGVVTYGSQTHPADGAAGMIVTGEARARELAGDEPVAQVLSTGTARTAKSEMPKAPVPAAMNALADAGLDIGDVDVVTTHNPFAVNDIWFAEQTGFPLERMNLHGSSLIFGHPNGPTGARLVVELLHTLRERGGGVGLFTGCAAGDTAKSVLVKVG